MALLRIPSREAPKRRPRYPQEHPRGAQEAPRRPPRAPKRGPREPQDALKTIIGSKTPIFQKSSSRRSGIMVFEGKRVRLGGQNRPQEGRKGVQTRPRRRYEPKKVSREPQEASKKPQSHDPLALPIHYEHIGAGEGGGARAGLRNARGLCTP